MRRTALYRVCFTLIGVVLVITLINVRSKDSKGVFTPRFQYGKREIHSPEELSLEPHEMPHRRLNVTKDKCGSMIAPKVQEQTWMPVDLANNSYVFSAYVDVEKHTIVVIGAHVEQFTLYCQYWILGKDMTPLLTRDTQPVTTTFLGEDNGRKYKGVLYNCPWKNPVPTHVSVSTTKCGPPLHLLPLVNSTKQQTHEYKFTICLKPLHFRYGRAYELVEWIELNQLFGAEKFVIYNYSIAANVDQVLRYYSKRGLVDVVQWPLRMRTNSYTNSHTPEIHSVGMLSMLQDCFMRTRQYTEYVINKDVDEFIIPHGDKMTTWDDMIESMPRDYEVYLFRQTFFRKEWDQHTIEYSFKEHANRFNLVTLKIFEHEVRMYAAGHRSKYIIRTNRVGQLHVHDVLGTNIRTYTAPTNVGFVHHYRNVPWHTDRSLRVVEKIILDKYGTKLIQNVEKIWTDLEYVKMHIPYS